MPLFPHHPQVTLRSGLLALALLCSATTPGFSQNPPAAPKKEVSEKVSEELGKIRTQTDAKNYDAAVAIIDNLIKTAAPESYDLALLSQVKAQILLTKGDYAKSIEPLETAVNISAKYNFFDEKTSQDLTYYLSQIYYQEAVNSKVTATQKAYYEKASHYMERWAQKNKKPNPDVQLYYASLLFYQAQLDPNNINLKLIKRAQEEVEKGMAMSARPKDTFYLLLFATLQQQNEIARSAEVLELYLKQKPDAKSYWPQLASIYLNLQQDVRAALTIERAQKFETMNSPKDNFTLVGLYFNMGQFDHAISLLSKGLKDGTIENDQRNWELLAASYMQMRQEIKAIETLKEAGKLFPEAGSIPAQIAQTYYQLDKLDEAYQFAKTAVTKKLEKPWVTQMFLAYVAYELKKYDEALVAINKAASYKEGTKDAERLKKAVEEAIKEQNAANEPPVPEPVKGDIKAPAGKAAAPQKAAVPAKTPAKK